MVANAAFGRTTGCVVMHPPTRNLIARTIVASKWDRHFEDSAGGNYRFDETVFEFQPLAGLTHTKLSSLECRIITK